MPNKSNTFNTVKHLTIICIRQDGHAGGGELLTQTATHGHAKGDIKAFLCFVERVIDDDHTAVLLSLALIETQHAVVFLGSGNVVRIGKHSSGNSALGCTCTEEDKGKIRGSFEHSNSQV